MKLDIFTWIPASSAGMTILLFAAQLNAAGVCIVCPPGHDCPAGGAPVITGAVGQILKRTATGTRWVGMDEALRFPQGGTGNLHVCAIKRLAGNAPVQWSCIDSGSSPPGNFQHSATTGLHCWCRFGSHSGPNGPSCPNSRWVHDREHGPSIPFCTYGCPSFCMQAASWRVEAA